MQEIQYIGEDLLPGRLGQLFVVIAFVSAIFSLVSFRKSTILPDDASWLRLSRWSWGVHTFSILFSQDSAAGQHKHAGGREQGVVKVSHFHTLKGYWANIIF